MFRSWYSVFAVNSLMSWPPTTANVAFVVADTSACSKARSRTCAVKSDASWSALWPPNSRSLPVRRPAARRSLRLPVIVASTAAMPFAFWFTRRVRASRLDVSARTTRFDWPLVFSAIVPFAWTPRSGPFSSSCRIWPEASRYVPSTAARSIVRPPTVDGPRATRPCASTLSTVTPFEMPATVASTSRSPATFPAAAGFPDNTRGIEVGKRARRFDVQRVAAKRRVEREVLDAAGPDRRVGERTVGRDFQSPPPTCRCPSRRRGR